LEQLRSELSALGPDAGLAKEHINRLIDDLEEQFQGLENAAHRATLRDRIARLIVRFESEHPSITGMLDRIVTTLANIGV